MTVKARLFQFFYFSLCMSQLIQYSRAWFTYEDLLHLYICNMLRKFFGQYRSDEIYLNNWDFSLYCKI